jgi:hypothetical protein
MGKKGFKQSKNRLKESNRKAGQAIKQAFKIQDIQDVATDVVEKAKKFSDALKCKDKTFMNLLTQSSGEVMVELAVVEELEADICCTPVMLGASINQDGIVMARLLLAFDNFKSSSTRRQEICCKQIKSPSGEECDSAVDYQFDANTNTVEKDSWELIESLELALSTEELSPQMAVTIDVPQGKLPYQVFISHMHTEAAGTASTLLYALGSIGPDAWCDMHQEDLTETGMRRGVEQSDVFLLLLTSNVLSRPFCLKEIGWALAANKLILIMHEEDERFAKWDYDRWRHNETWDAICREWTMPSDQPDKRPYDLLGCTAEGRRIRDMIDAQADIPGRIMPYRRRGFEQEALLHEFIRRVGDPEFGGDPSVEWFTRPPSPSAVMLTAANEEFTKPTVISVYAVYHGSTGASIAADLRCAIYIQAARNSMTGGFGEDGSGSNVEVRWVDDIAHATHAVVVLSKGVLDPESSSSATFSAVLERKLRFVFVLYTTANLNDGGWEFYSAEHEAVAPEIMLSLKEVEAVTYRPPEPAALAYEHRAMVKELVKRLFAGVGRTAQPYLPSIE